MELKQLKSLKANEWICQNGSVQKDADSDAGNLNKLPEFNTDLSTDVSQNTNCIVCLKTIKNVIKIYHVKLVKGMYTRSVLN